MSQLLESIKIRNGKALLLKQHQSRIEKSFAQLNWGKTNINLESFLAAIHLPSKGTWKCRIIYEKRIKSVQIRPYRIKHTQSLQVVEGDSIQYSLKTKDRKNLDRLFAERQKAEDIIIIKNKLVTDAYYANLLFLKEGKWYTPAQPLLQGVQRQILLEKKKIIPIDIPKKDIKTFEKIKLINAMLDIKEGPEVEIDEVYF